MSSGEGTTDLVPCLNCLLQSGWLGSVAVRHATSSGQHDILLALPAVDTRGEMTAVELVDTAAGIERERAAEPGTMSLMVCQSVDCAHNGSIMHKKIGCSPSGPTAVSLYSAVLRPCTAWTTANRRPASRIARLEVIYLFTFPAPSQGRRRWGSGRRGGCGRPSPGR